MLQYLQLVYHHMAWFQEVNITHIPHEQNMVANQLAKLASPEEPDNIIEIIKFSSIEGIETNPVDVRISWMTPIISYLQERTLLVDS